MTQGGQIDLLAQGHSWTGGRYIVGLSNWEGFKMASPQEGHFDKARFIHGHDDS